VEIITETVILTGKENPSRSPLLDNPRSPEAGRNTELVRQARVIPRIAQQIVTNRIHSLAHRLLRFSEQKYHFDL
jgi:hypothetical protein